MLCKFHVSPTALHPLLLPPLLCIFLSFISPNNACTQVERDSLLSFLRNISSTPSLNWVTAQSPYCCNWEGVSCNSNGSVTSLWLPRRGLRGPISPSLGLLPHLSDLNLSGNSLSGGIPAGLLDHLELFDLSSNTLVGEFPSLSLASNLTFLNASNNSFSGLFPSSICVNSTHLRVLDLSFNRFTDPIPQLGPCSELQIFRAGFNNLSGNVPDDLFDMVALQQLSLPFNRLSGNLSNRIVGLVNLTVLELNNNELDGGVPPEVGKMANLEQLLLFCNRLTGNLPSSLSNCTRLKTLNLRDNSLVGEISVVDYSNLTRLTTLDLGNNNFSGELPGSLYRCKSLTALRLAKNELEGEILSDMLSLHSLSYLSLSNNRFRNITSAFRILMGCRNLTAVLLSRNFIGEEIPDGEGVDLSSLQNLRVLGLADCHLKGTIPAWLIKLKRLEVLDLSFNQLSGSIPGWLGTLPNLFYIDLSSNLLTGELPMEITGIPILVSEEAAARIDTSYLELPVFVRPRNSSRLQYNQLSGLPPAIILTNNSLSGAIPPEMGHLKVLHVLDLSHNNFTGIIPDQLSNLTNLERLDLSWNHLSGVIPQSLKSLHFLSYFSVAYNNLQGQIPTGGQFDTFGSSSFEGNPGLCGLTLSQNCSSERGGETFSSPAPKYPTKKLLVGVVVGVCLGGGFVLTLLALWILSNRRINPGLSVDSKFDIDIVSSNSNLGFVPDDIIKNSVSVMLFPVNNAFKDLTLSDILSGTNNFDQANIIGCGGFGLVYKATLANGVKLAIKKLSGDMCLMEREFKAEVEALSTAQHQNLVSLRAYCVHGNFRLLIYSYMENGSLDYWLHEKVDGGARLDWPTRLRIAQGASRGLAYMHQICEPHIVHRDIKSSNILLNGDFEAHLADFGLSRLILPYNTHVTTELVGTLGYIPPEYGQAWVATLRGDIYSFGIVMLELLTGRRPVEVFKPKMSRELVVWVQQMRCLGKQDEVFEPSLRGKGHEDQMRQMLDVSCKCVNHNPMERPTIKQVVGCLESIGTDLQMPK